MATESGILEIFPKELHPLIVSFNPFCFWDLNKYFHNLAIRTSNIEKRRDILEITTIVGTMDLLMYLLHKGNYDEDKIRLALRAACEYGRLDILDELLKHSKEYSINTTLLKSAIQSERLDIIDRILEDPRVDPNELFSTFTYASKSQNRELFHHLLRHKRIDPTAHSSYSLVIASEYGNVLLVQELLQDSRANPLEKNFRALKIAINCNELRVLDLLLKDKRIIEANIIDKLIEHSYRVWCIPTLAMFYRDGYIDPKKENYKMVHFLLRIYTSTSGGGSIKFIYAIALLDDVIKDNRVDQCHPIIVRSKCIITLRGEEDRASCRKNLYEVLPERIIPPQE